MPGRKRGGDYDDDDDDELEDHPVGRLKDELKDEKPFEPTNREERSAFDNAADSKMSRRQGRLGGLGGIGGLSIWTDGFGFDDDDDDATTTALMRAADTSPGRNGAGGTSDHVREAEQQRSGGNGKGRAGEPTGRNGRGGGGGGKDMEWGGSGSGQTLTLVTADLRQSHSQLPEGLEVIGGDASFEEQEDGSTALVMPEGGYLKLSVPYVNPWSLEDDGKLHRYSLLLALRLDRLPTATLPLFHGGGPPTQGEQLDQVQVYKNGGVGALGQMGRYAVSASRVRPACVLIAS
jgi:hypothetical protein